MKKILIVEDDAFLQTLIRQKISEKGYTVLTAKDGKEALSLAEKEIPALILLDIILPGMSGFEILERLKALDTTKNIQVIMLSNISQQKDIDKAYALGAANFYIKSNTSPHEIVEKIDAIFKGA